MTRNGAVSNELAKELEQVPGGDGLKSELEAKRRKRLDAMYPEPTQAEVLTIAERLRSDDAVYHEKVERSRQVRFLEDRLPKKWQRGAQDGRRFYSRLSHNEIMRVVAIQTRNPYVFRVPPRGSTKRARDRGQKQTRWANQFFPAMERRSQKALRRQAVDGQNGDGRSAWLIYLTKAYENLDLKEREGEKPKDYMERTEEEFVGAGSPIGIRALDKLTFHLDEDGEGVAVGVVRERKPTNATWYQIRGRLGPEEYEKHGLPDVGKEGSSIDYQPSDHATSSVDTVHYWDRRWHFYFVDNRLVDGPEEHGLPGVPIIPIDGMVTSSDERNQQYQGITWGMDSLELATNDLLTRELDNAFTYQKPRWIIEQTQADGVVRGTQEQPFRLDLQAEGVPELLPGQRMRNVFENWEPAKVDGILGWLNAFWQKSGLNNISTGESPGSDPAGYTVNTLMGASQNLYEVNLDNEARAAGAVIDFVRLMIRDVIKQPMYLSVPMEDTRDGGTEWLGLGPDDVDETPVETSIDPLSDVNRAALQVALRQGYQEGFVPRAEVQRRGYGADDPAMWDMEIAMDKMMDQLTLMAMEEAKARIYGRQQATDPTVNPVAAEGGDERSIIPAEPEPPTVGADNAASSREAIPSGTAG